MIHDYLMAGWCVVFLAIHVWVDWRKHTEFMEEQDAATKRSTEGRALERRWRF